MHEMSIMESVLRVAENEARKNGSTRINRIKLKLGEFRGVVKEALEFAFEALKSDTLAANAELEVETVRLRVVCAACGEMESSPQDYNFLCPRCGQRLKIIAGREMQIEYLDLE
jgi:hydrogenase nickel incorporation protein HypA/HybF